MNNVCLVGRLTRDPELRTTATGLANCRFSIAVDGRPGANGEPHTDFINIVVWRNQAENVSKYCRKGSLVGITGRIQTGSYQAQDGSTRYTTDVVADNVRFLSSKNGGSNEFADNMPDYSMGDIQSNTMDINDSFDGMGSQVLTDDDELPF